MQVKVRGWKEIKHNLDFFLPSLVRNVEHASWDPFHDWKWPTTAVSQFWPINYFCANRSNTGEQTQQSILTKAPRQITIALCTSLVGNGPYWSILSLFSAPLIGVPITESKGWCYTHWSLLFGKRIVPSTTVRWKQGFTEQTMLVWTEIFTYNRVWCSVWVYLKSCAFCFQQACIRFIFKNFYK